MLRKESRRRREAFKVALEMMPVEWYQVLKKNFPGKYSTKNSSMRLRQIHLCEVAMNDDEISDLKQIYPAAVRHSGLEDDKQ